MSLKGFGARVKELRSQKELGKRIGVHYLHIGRYEHGTTGPSVDSLMRLAKVFDVTLDFLVYGSDARTHIDDEELFYLFKSVLELSPQDRIEAKQLVASFVAERRGR
jgi:transcriptional regulator with XRE-family HTH domain